MPSKSQMHVMCTKFGDCLYVGRGDEVVSHELNAKKKRYKWGTWGIQTNGLFIWYA